MSKNMTYQRKKSINREKFGISPDFYKKNHPSVYSVIYRQNKLTGGNLFYVNFNRKITFRDLQLR